MRGNVYTPGAGHRPPVLAGREDLLHAWALTLNDLTVRGRPGAKDLVLVGPRGVGKTSAMAELATVATAQGFEHVALQAVTGRAGLVTSLLQRVSERVSDGAGPWTRAKAAFDRIASVAFGVAGVSVSLSAHPEGDHTAMVDASSLASAFAALAGEVRKDNPQGGVLITLDELQVAAAGDIALLAGALHRLNVEHADARVAFVATGLPHTYDVLLDSGVTHPDRLFRLEPLAPALTPHETAFAIVEPARRAGIAWQPEAVAAVVSTSGGYPAHVQFLASAVWDAAADGAEVLTAADATRGIDTGFDSLTARTWGPTLDRLADRDVEYLSAVSLAGGSTTTKRLRAMLDQSGADLSRVRDRLIRSGYVYGPRRGVVTLTEPLFARFVVSRYEDMRADSDLDLAPLEAMRSRLQALSARGTSELGESGSVRSPSGGAAAH